ncbi:MAG TPA: hypothetical protein ENI07_06035 [Desulfobacterales bacterium]|nr:hypothetical protein [Desulfobacterales bacterium]
MIASILIGLVPESEYSRSKASQPHDIYFHFTCNPFESLPEERIERGCGGHDDDRQVQTNPSPVGI